MRDATSFFSTLAVAVGVAALGLGVGCEDPPPPVAPPTPTVVDEAPVPPTLESLEAPGSGRANVGYPHYDTSHSRFDFPLRALAAKVGSVGLVAQLQLGESIDSGVFLTFYGDALAPGTYRVLPATDETRTAHAGRDADIFIATLGQGPAGQLRSESGSVVIDTVERESGDIVRLSGTLDILLRSQNNLRETTVRARFDAQPDRWIQAELEHQEAIREQLRHR